MDARFGSGPNPPAGPLPVPAQRKIILQQVMALCVQVEDRNSSKTALPVPANSATVELCHYYQKAGHKARDCRHMVTDKLVSTAWGGTETQQANLSS